MKERQTPQEARWPDGTIFTVGHSTLPLEDFISLLRTYGIACVADIRTVPRSRYNPQSNGDALGHALKRHNIEYGPLPALGGLRRARKDSSNSGWRNTSFRGYADYMQTDPFEAGLVALIDLSRQRHTAMMCAEAVPWRCHRSLVVDALSVRSIPAVDILSARSARLHQLTPFAQVQGTHIIYPPKQGSLLL